MIIYPSCQLSNLALMKTKFFLTALLASLCVSVSHAALLFEEYFDYELSNNTNIADTDAWVGGTNNVRFQNLSGPNFTGSGYVPTHAGGVLESGNSNSSDTRMSHAPLGTSVSGEFWVSVFVNPTGMTNANGSVTLLNFSTGTTSGTTYGGGPGFGIYNDGSNLNFALFNGLGGAGGVSTVGSAASANAWQLLIAQVTINENADDSISVWSFADNAAVPTTISGLGAPVVSSSSLDWGNSINTLGIGGQSFVTGGGKTALWDDIRVSTLSGDDGIGAVTVIPEPSTYALIFSGLALGIVVLRRRVKKTNS